MSFEQTYPLEPQSFAITNPLNAVCDFGPDIQDSMKHFEQLGAQTSNRPVAEMSTMFTSMLEEGMLRRQLALSSLSQPSTRDMQHLFGIFTTAKMLEHPAFALSEETVALSDVTPEEVAATPDLTALSLDLYEIGRPRVHMEPSEIGRLGLVIPEGKTSQWYRHDELYLEVRQPASATTGMKQLFEANGHTFEDESLRTIFPVLKARSTPETHQCRTKIAIALIDLDGPSPN